MEPVEMMEDMEMNVSIEDLPEFVLVYILSSVSPYNDLKSCMLVNRHWYILVREVIRRRKQDFICAIQTRNVCWEKLKPDSDQGPTITRRYGHSSCIHKNALYVFGGCTYSYTTFNDLWKFDLDSKEWIRPLTTGTYPSPKACASVISFGDEIWLFGGWTHPSPYPFHQGLTIYKEFHSYNSVTNKWTAHITCREPPASAAHSVSLQRKNYMVFFGGLKAAGGGRQYTSSNVVWMFDMQQVEWQLVQTSTMAPSPRYGHSQISINDDTMLIMGGCGGPNMQVNDIWILRMPEDLTDLWMWQQVQVHNSPSKAYLLWSSPAVKVESTIVVLSSESSTTSGCQLPPNKVIVRYKALEKDSNSNVNEEAQENSEPNVNGRKGSFKRRHPINNQTGASSSSDEADNVASSSSSSLSSSSSNNSNLAQVNGEHSEQSNSNKLENSNSVTENKSRRVPMKNRQRQLEILRRYEAQIRASQPRSNLQFKGVTPRESITYPQRRLQVYSLDLSDLLTLCEVTWNSYPSSEDAVIMPRNGPAELMRYSLNAGNSEIILFGGVNRETEVNVSESESHEIVSNSIYFISAKKYVI